MKVKRHGVVDHKEREWVITAAGAVLLFRVVVELVHRGTTFPQCHVDFAALLVRKRRRQTFLPFAGRHGAVQMPFFCYLGQHCLVSALRKSRRDISRGSILVVISHDQMMDLAVAFPTNRAACLGTTYTRPSTVPHRPGCSMRSVQAHAVRKNLKKLFERGNLDLFQRPLDMLAVVCQTHHHPTQSKV